MNGELHPPKTMFLRNTAGEATDNKGMEYEMSFGMGGSPIIRSKKTGVWFTLSWKHILNLAKDAGIDKPWKEASK